MHTLDVLKNENEKKCKGRIYRCRVSRYINYRGDYYVEAIKMVLLKRMSCPGCEECNFIADNLQEGVFRDIPPIIDKISPDGLYKLVTTGVSVDWETRVTDDWNIKFELIGDYNVKST